MGSAAAFIAYLEDLERRGVHEEPDGSNCCEVCREFGPIGNVSCYAWCAATVCNGLARAGVPHKKSASVGLLVQSAKAGEFGALWLPKDATIRVGDSPCYAGNPANWNTYHINTVTNPLTQSVFEGLGGNQSNRVSRNHYGRSTVMGFIRWAFDAVVLPTPAPTLPAHRHDLPVVKFATGGPDERNVHGAVRRPNGTWVWQTDYRAVFWEVKDIQQHMANQGHHIAVDGIGGPDTLRQVKEYQRARGLAADGVVGPNTWAKLHA